MVQDRAVHPLEPRAGHRPKGKLVVDNRYKVVVQLQECHLVHGGNSRLVCSMTEHRRDDLGRSLPSLFIVPRVSYSYTSITSWRCDARVPDPNSISCFPLLITFNPLWVTASVSHGEQEHNKKAHTLVSGSSSSPLSSSLSGALRFLPDWIFPAASLRSPPCSAK